MRHLSYIVFFLAIATVSQAKIYKWVDENGSVHFSDKAYAEDAKEIKVRESNITIIKSQENAASQKASSLPSDFQKNGTETDPLKGNAKRIDEEKIITEADYKIISSVGKLGSDIISISGRVSSGPRCKDMTVSATAKNDNGLSGSITDQISKTNSYGSTIFEGNAKVSGSADDFGFWEVSSVTVRCNDQ